MRVIFDKDVPRVAKRHDVKDVSPGYARNYLLQRNIARLATPSELKELSTRREREEKVHVADEEKQASRLNALADITIEISGRANDEGHLFAAVHVEDIASKLKEGYGIEIEPRFLKIEEPIKALGTYTLQARRGKGSVPFAVRVSRSEEK